MTAPRDPWFDLASRTPARIGLGRAGASMPTREVLAFALAHAQARDAVHARLDRVALAAQLSHLQLSTIEVQSEAGCDRPIYLRRPDLGRSLSEASRQRLANARLSGQCDVAMVLGDGLSAMAVMAHAPEVVAAFLPFAVRHGWRLGPIALVAGARVALGDAIGQALGARIVAVLIGERPGLTASDSLGIYLTYEPHAGRTDAERNCISNIRQDGLTPAMAAFNLAWLIDAALTRRLTGVDLKDESDQALGDNTVARPKLQARDQP